MDINHWTEERVDKLRGLLLEKWKGLGEDDGAWGDWLLKHGIFVMGLRDVRRAWNMGCRGVCIENPTFEVKSDVVDILDHNSAMPTYVEDLRKAACEETWYLVPDEFAKKALVLGMP